MSWRSRAPPDPEGDPGDLEDLPPKRPERIVFHRAPVSARELAFSLGAFLPAPLAFVLVAPFVAEGILLGVVAGVGLGLLLRRLPTPVPSIAAMPCGFVWVISVLLLPPGPWAIAIGLLAGVAILLLASLPAPSELAIPLEAVAAQASIPAVGAALAFGVAISLLGVSAPIFDVALVPLLGALALAVYLFGRTDVVPTEPESEEGPGSSPYGPSEGGGPGGSATTSFPAMRTPIRPR